jgi:hypothetical protein
VAAGGVGDELSLAALVGHLSRARLVEVAAELHYFRHERKPHAAGIVTLDSERSRQMCAADLEHRNPRLRAWADWNEDEYVQYLRDERRRWLSGQPAGARGGGSERER